MRTSAQEGRPPCQETVALLRDEAATLRRWAATRVEDDPRRTLEMAERLERHADALSGLAAPVKAARLRPILPKTTRMPVVRLDPPES